MKRRFLFSLLITVLVIVLTLSLLTACDGEQTIESIRNDYGILVEGGGFGKGAIVVSKVIDIASEDGRTILEAIKDQEYNKDANLYAFDISVELEGVKVQPNGKVKVSIPMNGLDLYNYDVLHIKNDGTVERLDAVYEDYIVSFETDSFSIFVLVGPFLPNHVHTFSDKWSADEYVHWHAATCEHTDERSGENEHDWDDGTETKPATDDEDGEIKYTCKICGYEKNEAIHLHTHTFSREWSKSDTHHWHAATCEHTDLKDSYEEHYYNESGWWDIIKPATETEEGEKVRVCIGCKYEDHQPIPKLEHVHKFSEEWTSEGGYHWHSATCEHTDEVDGKEACSGGSATCTQKAVCSVCEKEYGDLLPHDFTAQIRTEEHLATPATCQTPATYYYCCSICKKNGTETFSDPSGTLGYCSYVDDVCTICDTPAGYWLTFKLRSDGESYMVGSSNMPYGEKTDYLRIPSTYKGKPVVEIQDGALTNPSLKTIVIPDSIEIIGKSPFNTALETLIIGKGLKTIADSSFKGIMEYGKPSTITVSEENPYFKVVDGIMYSKDGKTLVKYPATREGTELIIDSNVERIWSYAFEYAKYLKSVVIPNSVTDLMHYAFCFSSITSVDIGLGVETISQYAFSNSDLTSVKLEGNIKTIEEGAFMACDEMKVVTFGSKLITIGNQSFYDCIKISEIIIPDNVKTIGSYSFSGTNGATRVVMGSGIEEIPDYAFASSTASVKDPTVIIGSNVKTIGIEALYGLKVSSITIPASVRTICRNAFDSCSKLTSIVIPNTVETLDVACFADCKELQSVTLGSTLTEIPQGTFSGCRKLASISIPNNIKSIGDGAFFACILLETVDFGSGVTSIGNGAFENCYALKDLNLPSNLEIIGEKAFLCCEAITTVVVPGGVKQILNNAFKGCIALKSITLPSSIDKIKTNIFSGCKALDSISLSGESMKLYYYPYPKVYSYDLDSTEKIDALFKNNAMGDIYLFSWSELVRTNSELNRDDVVIDRWEDK